MMDRNWELFDNLIECLGADTVALNVCQAISADEMNEALEYIATCFGVSMDEEV